MKTAKTFEKLLWLVPVEVSFLENFPPREREQATWRDDQGIEIKILEFFLGKKLFETQKRIVKRRHNNSEPGIAITILHPAIYVPEPHYTITWRGRAVYIMSFINWTSIFFPGKNRNLLSLSISTFTFVLNYLNATQYM